MSWTISSSERRTTGRRCWWRRARGTLTLATLALLACASDDAGIAPPRDGFYFPTGLALEYWRDPATGVADYDRPLLLVANANADLRYNGGTLMVLDLSAIPDDLSAVGERVASGVLDCRPDPSTVGVWTCPEQAFAQPGATIRIGDFPSELAISVREEGKQVRVLAPVRGQGYLLWAEVKHLPGGQIDLRCDSDPTTGCGSVDDREDCPVWDCDSAGDRADGAADDLPRHQVNVSRAGEVRLPAEPFGLYLNPAVAVHIDATGDRRTCLDHMPEPPPCDCGAAEPCPEDEAAPSSCCLSAARQSAASAGTVDHIYVTHLSGGEVSFFEASSSRVELKDVRSGLFGGATPIGGAFGIAAQLPGDLSTPVWVSSRFDNGLASFVIDEDRIIPGERLAISALEPANDLRGLAFAHQGARGYVVSQLPPALVALDMAPDDTPGALTLGRRGLWTTELCSDPSKIVLAPDPVSLAEGGRRQLAYLPCFTESEIGIVDTELGEVAGRIVTGLGPATLLVDMGPRNPCEQDAECGSVGLQCADGRCMRRRPRAFVANFLENTIGVIDLDPGHATYRRMVLRIGTSVALVRDL